MSYLVYCIVAADRHEPRPRLRFLGYPRACIAVRACELGAVASETSPADLAPDVARLLAYSKVVEWYNRDGTVIPMRYGCIFDTPAEIRRLLDDRQREYRRLLDDLDGCAEMSAQVALDEPGPFAGLRANLCSPLLAQFAGRRDRRPGIAYLADRSEYYASREDLDQRREEICNAIRGSAQGTFVRCSSEYGERGGRGFLALHFLVSRHGIDRFRKALQPLTAHAASSVAVTGPWPPYNFVRSSAARLKT
ncbi:MAG: GvpL/GvpF family gas vesicle protein [Candidatus Binataceae bacterium]